MTATAGSMSVAATNRQTMLDTGRRVILSEAEALSELAGTLDGSFSDAVELLAQTTGRVIVSGIGKSGHVGRKIAATLASTGKPAHFVHPAEASHGDLGMMAVNDSALVLSNSGETAELADILAYTKRFGIPLVGIAGNRDSILIRQADVGIVIPNAIEAGEIRMIPTVSTTMMLAVGDAIAVSLMEHRSFTPELFREFHPGGMLGARLSTVRDLMHTGDAVPLVSGDTVMTEALIEMSRKGFGVAGICSEDGRLEGVITDGDLRRHMDGLLDNRASQVMTRNPVTIASGELAATAVGLMNERMVTCLFAVDSPGSGRVEGILHIHDCLRAGVA